MADGYLNTPANSPGLFAGLDPSYQIEMQKAAAARAFSDGLPTDANGNPDFGAMAKSLYAKGDYGDASNLMQTGISQQMLKAAQAPSAVLGAGTPAAQPSAYNPNSPPSTTGANPEVVSYIAQAAAKRGIPPNIALGVAGAEGLRGFDPNGKPNLGDDGSSAGPFQLHYGGVAPGGNSGPGLGDDFTKATGLDARDPSTWKAQVDFSLDHAATNGWGAWHGAAKVGIGQFAGIGGQSQAPQQTASSNSAGTPPPVQVAQNGANDATNSDEPPPSTQHPYAPSTPAFQKPTEASPPGGAAPTVTPVALSGAPAAPTPAPGAGGPSVAPSPLVGQPPRATTPYASNGSNFVDPTLGGLVTPEQLQQYGSYGGVAKAAAAEAASLGNNPYAKEKAAVLLDYAKQIMSTVAKANELTSEQKNARDPTVVQQQQDLATTRAKARVEAQTDNALVPAAQPDGSVTMMPKRVALAQAAAGNGPMQSLPGYVTSGQQNLLTKLNDGSVAYASRQVSGERLDALSNLLSTYQTGANSTAFNNAAAKLRSIGIEVPQSAMVNPAAMQQFAKNAYANVLSSMQEQGNKQFVAEVTSAINSNPNTELQPDANAAMIAQMKGIQAYHDQNYRDYADWYGANKGASNDAQFQIQWAKQNPLAPYITAARKDIAPMGVPLPPPDQLVNGQAYMVQGRSGPVKARWNASVAHFIPVGH